jgi:heme-degrading monooxygenase HmoA
MPTRREWKRERDRRDRDAVIVVLFRSRLTAAAGDDYRAMDEEIFALARQADGFEAVKSFRADDGERLTIVWWRDAESLARWRNDPRHRVAQQTGRARWYEYYAMEVAEVVRESRFRRPPEEGG